MPHPARAHPTACDASGSLAALESVPATARVPAASCGWRPGPGSAIMLGLCMALVATWISGGNARGSAHMIEVLATRVSIVLLALSIHEWAHGAAALMLGDTTARDMGRLTLNPVSHFDTAGMLIVPGILVAAHSPFMVCWARPVPVDFSRLRHPRLGVALVAAAGPASNFLLAFFCSSVLRLLGLHGTENLATSAAWTFAVVNLGLGLFNLLPFYPMDGGRMLSSLAPGRVFRWLALHERVASIGVVSCLCMAPLFVIATGVGTDQLEALGRGLSWVVATFTGSPDGAWFGPMAEWLKTGVHRPFSH